MNVYRLGRTFMRFVGEEKLQFEPVDPSVFVDRILATNQINLSLQSQTVKVPKVKAQASELVKMAKKVRPPPASDRQAVSSA